MADLFGGIIWPFLHHIFIYVWSVCQEISYPHYRQEPPSASSVKKRREKKCNILRNFFLLKSKITDTVMETRQTRYSQQGLLGAVSVRHVLDLVSVFQFLEGNRRKTETTDSSVDFASTCLQCYINQTKAKVSWFSFSAVYDTKTQKIQYGIAYQTRLFYIQDPVYHLKQKTN